MTGAFGPRPKPLCWGMVGAEGNLCYGFTAAELLPWILDDLRLASCRRKRSLPWAIPTFPATLTIVRRSELRTRRSGGAR